MASRKGEVYRCLDENCGCEITVTRGTPDGYKGQGSGLKLSVAYKIAAQHEGTLTTEITGRDAIFHLKFNKPND